MDKSSPTSAEMTRNALYHTQAANMHALRLEREFQHLPAGSTDTYKFLGENKFTNVCILYWKKTNETMD